MPNSSTQIPQYATAVLLLADGSCFFGQGVGAKGTNFGEICFNTGLTGYQEVITDPSYAGQIITFTFPHIGNVGANIEDVEANITHARGIVIREPITEPSNYRSQYNLQNWLSKHKIVGICNVDTRQITRHIRKAGAQNAVICHFSDPTKVNLPQLLEKLKAHPSLDGMELANEVTSENSTEWNQTSWSIQEGFRNNNFKKYKVVAIDYGAKLNILRCLVDLNCEVIVVPAKTSAEEILSLQPDGIFLSNGPGDPSATGKYAIPVIQALIKTGIPIFGICLGHQLLSLSLGCTTYKMHQGHRGANHPVQNIKTGKVEITSQNHGFVVKAETIPQDVELTHISLFDGTVEGIRLRDKPVFSVQYHPESSPGPHDSRYLFKQFVEFIESSKNS